MQIRLKFVKKSRKWEKNTLYEKKCRCILFEEDSENIEEMFFEENKVKLKN